MSLIFQSSAFVHGRFRIISSSSRISEDGITTVSERTEGVDPILQRLQSLEITKPILASAPAKSSLTDILVRKPFSSPTSGNISLIFYLFPPFSFVSPISVSVLIFFKMNWG